MFDYGFDYKHDPTYQYGVLYHDCNQIELEATQLYLVACEAMATACTATAPYLIECYGAAERALRARYKGLIAPVIRAEDKRALNALVSARLYLNIVRERLRS